MQFNDIRTLEPRIEKVIRIARTRHPEPEMWDEVYRQYKGELDHLVGFGAEKPELRTAEAYETVIRELGYALGQ